jgi:hypothetical protein
MDELTIRTSTWLQANGYLSWIQWYVNWVFSKKVRSLISVADFMDEKHIAVVGGTWALHPRISGKKTL